MGFLINVAFSRRCATPDCPGVLTYDGREQCVLNMNKFLFAYEVLRGFMFHFLLGRYVKLGSEPCIWVYIPHSNNTLLGPPCTQSTAFW